MDALSLATRGYVCGLGTGGGEQIVTVVDGTQVSVNADDIRVEVVTEFMPVAVTVEEG